MGMFDSLYINTDMLPISDKEKELIGGNVEWQTKSYENMLTAIFITDDGLLEVDQFELEEVPKEERPNPHDEGILGLMGSLKRVNERRELITYHGIINFYTSVKGKWYSFNAKFTNGKLESIESTD